MQQQQQIGDMWAFISSVLKHALKGQLGNLLLYPAQFVPLLHGGAAVQAQTLAQMKKDWHTFSACKQSTAAFWKKVCLRSCFVWTYVHETFTLAEACGWEISQSLQDQVKRGIAHFGHTFVIECMFQKCTDHADRDSADRKLSQHSL